MKNSGYIHFIISELLKHYNIDNVLDKKQTNDLIKQISSLIIEEKKNYRNELEQKILQKIFD